ncbi:glutamate racemase [Thermodesulfatator indicus DSM 15286]|uniref:Glutamate racemase n=1 Tax=Thermodesulfatator indicus (strain DSM 15286 / JCM 11887 / CIR29812) TaxID=667014 RepID=F8AC01_THEID|nr:glutamate racemase [Thermodesulfatator indicus]AEH45699.1 glutamate racemase [Thermodesulfatator indicus DSM 15286]
MIGVFDSGIGGLTIVREILRKLPGYRIIYFGDTARTPYGTKSPETIISYAIQDAEFLLEYGAKIIVVACHSASSVATEALRERFPDVPIFEVVSPSVKKALAVTTKKIIGVIGTRATISSGIYQRKIAAIDPEVKVYGNACPLLVPLVEEGWLKKPETRRIVKKCLIPLKIRGIDTLVLGCTHYPLLKPVIQAKAGRRVRLVDPAEEVAIEVAEFLKANPRFEEKLSRGDEPLIYVSDLTEAFERVARLFMGRRITLLKADCEMSHIIKPHITKTG